MSNDVIETLPGDARRRRAAQRHAGLFVDTNGPALSPTMTFFNAHSSTQ